jgi:hypothetical protein
MFISKRICPVKDYKMTLSQFNINFMDFSLANRGLNVYLLQAVITDECKLVIIMQEVAPAK